MIADTIAQRIYQRFATPALALVTVNLIGMVGYKIIGGEGSLISPPPELEWSHPGASAEAFLRWIMTMGTPLAVGLVALALGLAALGYVCVQIGWRAYVIRAWRKRGQLRSKHGR